jgi:hypothetical protein
MLSALRLHGCGVTHIITKVLAVNTFRYILAGLVAASLLFNADAVATIFDVNVDFSATGFSDLNNSVPTPPAKAVSSEFSFIFDDSVVQGFVGEIFQLTPTTVQPFSINDAFFDASNTEVLLGYKFGILVTAVFGGIPANSIGVGRDDFSLRLIGNSFEGLVFDQSAYTLAEYDRAFFQSVTGSAKITVVEVPAPTSLLILVMGIAGLGTFRHRG